MDDRKDRIADAVRGLLDDGESVVVARNNGQTTVVGGAGDKTASLAGRDAEFYGYCATLNEDLDGATGCLWMVACLLFALGASYAVEMFLPEYSDWRAYTALVVLTGIVWDKSDDFLTMRVYRAARSELRDRMSVSGLSQYELIGMLGDDGNVDTLAKYLKKDRELGL